MTRSASAPPRRLRAVIEQVMDMHTTDSDPRNIAKHVMDVLTTEERDHYFFDLLVAQVRSVVGDRRSKAMSEVFAPRPVRTPPPDEPAAQTPETEASDEHAEEKPVEPRFVSSRVQMHSEAWADFIASPIHVGSGGWIPIGECGHLQLQFAYEERRKLSEMTAIAARKMKALDEALTRHGVALVNQLPPEVEDELTLDPP